jgi:hypothetical protein
MSALNIIQIVDVAILSPALLWDAQAMMKNISSLSSFDVICSKEFAISDGAARVRWFVLLNVRVRRAVDVIVRLERVCLALSVVREDIVFGVRDCGIHLMRRGVNSRFPVEVEGSRGRERQGEREERDRECLHMAWPPS